MRDDPDRRMDEAGPPAQPLAEALELGEPTKPGKPYHHAIDPDLRDELHLHVGMGLALADIDESETPAARVGALARYIDRVRAGEARAASDAQRSALALACLFGEAIAHELGWGWAHLRRSRHPGIVLVSPDCRYAIGPRRVVDRALAEGGSVLLSEFDRFRGARPPAAPGAYSRLELSKSG
jgi:hypothetical protein